MLRVGMLYAACCLFCCQHCQAAEAAPGRLRVLVSTDLGGSDPDDIQSMVHYLVYADRFDTEGLVSSPPGKGRAEDILACIDAYDADFASLRTWSSDYPTPDSLRAVVRQGAVDPQGDEVPEADLTPGAALLVSAALADDPRPLYVLVWGSLTDIAQAVHHAPAIKESVRLYSIGSWNTSQDRRAREYLFHHHPDMWWIENDTTFRGMYMGGDQSGDLGNLSFPAAHVGGHGFLGDLFVTSKRDIKMGDSPSVLYLLSGDPGVPTAPHWGGAFVRPFPDQRPRYWHDDPDPELRDHDRAGARTVNRWRSAYLRDWQARMDRAQAPRVGPGQ